MVGSSRKTGFDSPTVVDLFDTEGTFSRSLLLFLHHTRLSHSSRDLPCDEFNQNRVINGSGLGMSEILKEAASAHQCTI